MNTTWTQTHIDGLEYSVNATYTHVTLSSTRDGQITLSVAELRRKVQDRFLHPTTRKMYQAMLDYYESEKK